MKKNGMTLALVAALAVTAMPKLSFADEKSMDQIIQMKKEQNQQVRIQVLNLKAQLSDMRDELRKEQNRFGYQTAKWTRNISLAVAGIAGVMTVVDYKVGNNRVFYVYGLITAASGLVAGLGQIGVALTNDQVVGMSAA